MHNVPQLRRLQEQFPHELVIIGVHSAKFPSEQSTENIRQVILRLGIDHPVVNDAGYRVWDEYSVRAWPTLVIIDPRGRIIGETTGEVLAEELAPRIRQAIDENQALIDPTPLHLRPTSAHPPERPLLYPAKVLLASETALFIADTGHHRVIEIRLDADARAGEVVRIIGRGERGFQDGEIDQATFNHPHGLALRGPADIGTLFVADTENHAIRAVNLETGTVRTLAGTGAKAHGSFALGKPLDVPLRSPWDLLALEQYLLIAMAGSHQIWVLIGEDQLGPFAGNGQEALVDGPVGEASFNQPSGLAYGLGHLFVADPEASAIRAISLGEDPRVITLVGQGLFEFGDRDGTGTEVRLQHPAGIAFLEGQLYIADSYNQKIKALDPTTGMVETLAGTGQAGAADGSFGQAAFFEPEGIQAGAGHLFIADTNNHRIRVADLSTHGVTTLTLRGLEQTAPPAPAREENFRQLGPTQVAPGQVELVFDLQLPEGYKLNPDAPASLRLSESGESQQKTFQPGEPIRLRLDVTQDRDLRVEIIVFYCQAGDARLCLIDDQRLSLPLKMSFQGPRSVHIPYRIEAPEL